MSNDKLAQSLSWRKATGRRAELGNERLMVCEQRSGIRGRMKFNNIGVYATQSANRFPLPFISSSEKNAIFTLCTIIRLRGDTDHKRMPQHIYLPQKVHFHLIYNKRNVPKGF